MEETYKYSTKFGQMVEYKIISKMLSAGLDVYTPVADDKGVDAIITKTDGSYIEIQIKGRGADVTEGNGALFPNFKPLKKEANYYFVFYSERMDKMWIIPSVAGELENHKVGKKKQLRLNGYAGGIENTNTQFKEYLADDFSAFAKKHKLT